MTTEPLRSALSMKYVEETSLAVPSDARLKSGQQRVLDQVHTIRRNTSKYSKSGLPSPTSPPSPAYNTFRWLKQSTSSKGDGSVFLKGHSNGGTSMKKTVNSHPSFHSNGHYLKAGGTARRSVSTSSQWEKRYQSIGPSTARPVTRPSIYANGLKPSRSNPELTPITALEHRSLSNMRDNRASFYSTNSGHLPAVSPYLAPTNISVPETKMSVPKARGAGEMTGGHGVVAPTEISMKEAVEYLLCQDENFQHFGASFIQHSTYGEEKAKQEVLKLKGIPPLVGLLHSPSTQVQQSAAAALRNLVFKNDRNKEEVSKCGGIAEASTLLKNTDVGETQKQLTGLLWNLSSAENLKPELVKTAVPVLAESVLVPFSGSEEHSASATMDPEIFYNATGCLRNLSSGKKGNRKAIRNTRGLIDSLVHYVQGCVEADRPDDKSVENCVCVLHNLTYQLETESPSHFSKITALAGVPSRGSAQQPPSPPPIGCFSQQSSKVPQETAFDYPVLEETSPKGAGWLLHSKAMQTYLSLLSDSESDATKEACVGALQNLTANKGIVSSVMSQAIVQKLNGLHHIAPLLQSSSPSIQKTALSLVGNLSRNPRLQRSMARQTLPQLASFLSSASQNGAESDDAVATACQAAGSLLMADSEAGKKQLSSGFINSLTDLSRCSYLPKSSKAASLLLYGLWSEKNFQTFLKKQGMNKSSFVNDITTAAHKAVQIFN